MADTQQKESQIMTTASTPIEIQCGITNGDSNDATSNTSTSTGQRKVNYQYENGDQGPFRVMVELVDTQNGKIKINKLSLASALRKMPMYKTHVIEMKQVGRNKLMVYFNNYQIANRLTTDANLKEKNYRAPKLPERVRIFCCSVGVRAFYRKTVLCQNCLRYNHQTTNCKSKRRCSNCTRTHEKQEEYNECKEPPRCLYCRVTHKTTDTRCPERTRQNNVQAIMARTNLTAIEAVEQFPIQTRNYYEALVESAQEPTPAESYATMTAGKYRERVATPLRPRKRTGDIEASTNIAEQVVVMKEKKKKTDGERQTNGVALFNKFKVTEAEKWKTQLRQAAKQQREQDDDMYDPQPTPMTSMAGSSNQEDFSRFVSSMIGEGKVNPFSLELK